jgi:hypothetical protein
VPKSGSPDDRPDQSLAALSGAIDQLRRELHELAASIALGVHTRELVVTGADGIPRIVISATDSRGSVEIFGRSGPGDLSSVELFGSDAIGGAGVHVGVALTERGDVVAICEALSGDDPLVWIGGDDAR